MDVSEGDGYEMDFELLDHLVEQAKLPILFYDDSTHAARDWERKLVDKLVKLVESRAAPVIPPPSPESTELNSTDSIQFNIEQLVDATKLGNEPVASAAPVEPSEPSEPIEPIEAEGVDAGKPEMQLAEVAVDATRRVLPAGVVVENYLMQNVIAGGGFSIVYKAIDLATKRAVVIKEYMPKRWCQREDNQRIVAPGEKNQARFNRGRKMFVQEARVLATLKHPNIVDVLSFFQAHGSAYMVMNFEQGKSLGKYIRTSETGLNERMMMSIFPELLGGLEAVHRNGYLHLDLKPGNVLIRPGGSPVLLDFGAIQSFHAHEPIARVITAGFAPPEQYHRGEALGPWTDIYAIGATMRTCIEVKVPPPAPERLQRDRLVPLALTHKKSYSKELLEAIDGSMELNPRDRPQTVIELLKSLPQLRDDMEGESFIQRLTGWSKKR
jgi:tRNA A-37 threonylcarbamoyl transferase component Bud32